jgi:aspartyl-tRNA(Asn)/glutamyl-tRNA(Gln) amidotransferase subunit A
MPLTIRAAAAEIAAGTLSPVELMEATLRRIDAQKALNAFLLVNPKARAEARRAEQAVIAGRRLGPLHGVPISVKDIILTRGMPTTAGSRTFGAGLKTDADSPVVRRLRRAGAVILGKTNLHELAMGVTSENEHFGPVHHPVDPSRVPGGSSGGSAVAVATGMGLGSVGTDTRGSIRIPAACCGIVGLKPSYGRVSTEGAIPLSPSLDHVGPMTRTVEDAALMLGAMAGTPRQGAAWLAATAPGPRPNLRIGLCDWFLDDLDPEVAGPVQAAIATFRAAGFEIQRVEWPGLAEAHAASGVITGAEALSFHQERLDLAPEGIGPLIRQRLEKARALTAVDYVRAVEAQVLLLGECLRVFAEVDCLVGATLPALPPRIGDRHVRIGDREVPVLEAFTRLTAVADMAGLPALSLPCGTSGDGMPVGLQLIAGPEREDIVLALGAWYERATAGR